MTYSVLVRASARQDIDKAQDWYSENAPSQLTRFLDELAATIDHIQTNPHAFRRLRADAQRATLRVFPYAVWYRVHDEPRVVEMLGLVHERQDPEQFRARLV